MKDLIDRQSVLDIIFLDPGISEMQAKMIIDLPSAEKKKGRWVFARYYVWECSECGKNPTKGMGYVQRKSELFRYCPHCGSEMEVAE